MPNTLGLVGDGDDLDLLRDLEEVFGLRFGDETLRWYTVGDVFAGLRQKVVGRGHGCATAMAFYRLRRGARDTESGERFGPGTSLDVLRHGANPRSFLKRLGSKSRLRMPSPMMTLPGKTGFLLAVAGFLGLLVVGAVSRSDLPWPMLVVLAGMGLMRLDPGRFPSGCRTLGDLAEKVAARNFGKLIAEGAAPREKHLWSALLDVLSDYAAVPASEIGPDTQLIGKSRWTA